MKEYCVDLEIAKELKENGFPQKCVCSYDLNGISNYEECQYYDFGIKEFKTCDISRLARFDAPFFDEILKELPRNINNFDLNILWVSKERTWAITYDMKNNLYTYDFTLKHALAKMWLYLKKEGYIK